MLSTELGLPDPQDPPEAPPTFQDNWWDELVTGGVTATDEELNQALGQE